MKMLLMCRLILYFSNLYFVHFNTFFFKSIPAIMDINYYVCLK